VKHAVINVDIEKGMFEGAMYTLSKLGEVALKTAAATEDTASNNNHKKKLLN
jgi:hypothetical protein